ncbi:uncharacterized protein LOC109797440 isoform X2 [Cajanus cajan]|uniref:uncharacterized protein LOC109797440 isoform X1 n=1 Tax=Cajanus cajan TaxID=3821 RepID=UPI00098DAB14|nr:uncharacterized protein LOC109797440 isoform X1 [Cajanus cajan]XP_029126980.1 uncharacterized protein LOC109797440 isoform X2 [Cajanus cajan]
MRCKKHLQDLTSTIGVCASCLRERLQPLLAAQAKAQAQNDADYHRFRKHKHKPQPEPEPEPEPSPPPINFPHSVSPYVARRKHERMFHGTPQVFAAAYDGVTPASTRRRSAGRFGILSSLFRGRSNKTETAPCEEPSSSASPPSWFSAMLHARRHHHGGAESRRCRQTDRGLSPAPDNFTEEAKDRTDSGFSAESSPWKQNPSPAPAPSNRRSRLNPGGGKGISTMAFCLSPLVRASPNRHWNHKGLAQEMGVGAGGAHHISSAASYCANRSRKLADFGRAAHNR